MHPHFKPLSKGKLEDLRNRKTSHQECLANLRTVYEQENREIEAIDAQLDEYLQTIKTLAEQDQQERMEDIQDSLEESDVASAS